MSSSSYYDHRQKKCNTGFGKKKGNDTCTPGMISAANDFPLNHNTALLISSVAGLSNYRQVNCFDRYI